MRMLYSSQRGNRAGWQHPRGRVQLLLAPELDSAILYSNTVRPSAMLHGCRVIISAAAKELRVCVATKSCPAQAACVSYLELGARAVRWCD